MGENRHMEAYGGNDDDPGAPVDPGLCCCYFQSFETCYRIHIKLKYSLEQCGNERINDHLSTGRHSTHHVLPIFAAIQTTGKQGVP